MKRKVDQSFYSFSLIICIVISFFYLQSCRKSEDNMKNCVDGLNLNKFYFYGTDTSYVNTLDYYESSNGSVTLVDQIPMHGTGIIIFNDNNTFTINLNFVCDTLHSAIPLCSQEDYNNGEINLEIKGIWDFEQFHSYQSYSIIHKDFDTYQIIEGECYLRITDSYDSSQIGNTVTSFILITCSYDDAKTRDYILEAVLPIYEGYTVKLTFVRTT